MKKLVVVYRNNELFEKYVPVILSHVPVDIIIEKIVYPAGTQKEVIAADLLPRLRAITEPFYYLSDLTCSHGGSRFGVYETLNQKGNMVTVIKTLDKIFKEEVNLVMIGGENFAASEDNLKITSAKLINLITDDMPPSRFIIVTSHIADHLSRELSEKYGESVVKNRPPDEKGFVTFLTTVFNQIYPTADVVQVEQFSQIKQLDFNNATTVIVVDRHHPFFMSNSSLDDITKWCYTAKLFMLPFENTLMHLKQLGKVRIEFDGQSLFNRLEIG